MRGPYQHSLEEGAPALVSDCHHWLRLVEQGIGFSSNGTQTESGPGQCGQKSIGWETQLQCQWKTCVGFGYPPQSC